MANQHNVSELLPPPHTGMHSKWIQAAMRPKYVIFYAQPCSFSCLQLHFKCISQCLVILLASPEACNPHTNTRYNFCIAYCQAHAVVQALPALLASLQPDGLQASLPKYAGSCHMHSPTSSLVRHMSLCSHHHVNSIIGLYVGHFQWPQHHAVMVKW